MIKVDLSDGISGTNALREEAIAFFLKKIETQPNNVDYLTKLTHLMREQGNIDQAMEFLSKILSVDSNNFEAKYLMSVLGQAHDKSPCRQSFCPAPFLYKENYLTNDELAHIWKTVKNNKNSFDHSELSTDSTKGKIDNDYRKSVTLYGNKLKDISGWFLEKISSDLSDICSYITIEPFLPSLREIQLTRHGNNEFFKIHQDSGDKPNIRTRTLTFVYYFHTIPRAFSGGEILLFDTDTKEDKCGKHFTKLTPANNSIVFFSSNYFHQVTPVYLKNDIFENGRFAIHGWLHKEE